MLDLEFVLSRGTANGERWPFPSRHFVLGSDPACGLCVVAPGVAPRHVDVQVDAAGTVQVRDLSGKGLVIDGQRATGGVVSPGAFFGVGGVELVLQEHAVAAGPSGTIARGGTPAAGTARFGATPSKTVVKTGKAAALERPAFEEFEAGDEPAVAVEPTVRSAILPPGLVVDGRYEIVGKLAEGGMGEVYRARHVELGKQLALKVMKAELSEDLEFVARFKREAVAASQIGHQNIIDVSDFGRTPAGQFYFVMEYVEGQTLEQLLHERGALPVKRAAHLITQVASALEAAHAKGIVHRDLKPENVMVLQRAGQPDFVKVLDFGVAKVARRKGEAGQTAVGMIMGTPQYMAPEQAQGLATDARCDIYALGLILYELLAGRPTFTGETPSILMMKHVHEPPPPFPETVAARIPERLQALVMQMLAKPMEQRPQSMGEVQEGLAAASQAAAPARQTGRAAVTGAGVPLDPEGDPTFQQPSRMPLAAGGAVLLLAAAGLGWMFLRSDGPPPPPPKPAVEAPAPAAPVGPVAKPAPVAAEPAPAPTPAPEKITLSFPKTTDEPARVFEGEVMIGVTPCTVTRARKETVRLVFRAPGYEDESLIIGFEQDQELPVAMKKVKEATPVARPAAAPQPARRQQPVRAADPAAMEDLKASPY